MEYEIFDTGKKYVFKIHPGITTKNKHYCVMQNPFSTYHDTKVLYGGSVEVVKREILNQFKKFKESAK